MKIIGHYLPAIALFLILVLGFVSTSTNAMKVLQFQSSTEEEQKGEVDKYATVYKSGPSTPTEPSHNGRRPPRPGGPPLPNANAILQRKELFVHSQSSRKEEEKEEVNYMHVFKSGPSTPTEPPHNRRRRPPPPPPPPHANAILQMKELHVQSHSSRKEEVNYMHVFKSGPSKPTEPPPLPLSRVGVLTMQPRKFPPPSRPARNHNVIPPNPS